MKQKRGVMKQSLLKGCFSGLACMFLLAGFASAQGGDLPTCEHGSSVT